MTAHIPQQRLFRVVERSLPFLLGFSRQASRLPVVGQFARRMVPVADYQGIYDLDECQLREWALLDTFDMLSPRYDKPQTCRTLHRWTQEAGLEEIEVGNFGHLVARGRKPERTPCETTLARREFRLVQ